MTNFWPNRNRLRMIVRRSRSFTRFSGGNFFRGHNRFQSSQDFLCLFIAFFILLTNPSNKCIQAGY